GIADLLALDGADRPLDAVGKEDRGGTRRPLTAHRLEAAVGHVVCLGRGDQIRVVALDARARQGLHHVWKENPVLVGGDRDFSYYALELLVHGDLPHVMDNQSVGTPRSP